ncbi:MAG TPA: apolipoprotein N-acyltransferase [Candidatus Hydrogenedentes bacterium]|nr:apolipoprotein N-acyltransferase [Candidatus Hydrogenedentota bacterium]
MKKSLVNYLPAILSGILLSWAFPRFHFHWLTWIALAPLFLSATRAAPAAAAIQFYLCGHIFYTLLLQWLIANIFWAGGWAIIGQQMLCVVLAIYWAVLGYIWRWAHNRSSVYAGALCLAGLWTGMELLQARMFTGFGWGALGYTQGGNLPVAQLASVGGVSFVSFAIILVNALFALAAASHVLRLKRVGGAVLILLSAHGAGYVLLGAADYESAPLTTGVVQTNFSQEMKWDPAYETDMPRHAAQLSRALAAHNKVDLITWPEALFVRHYGKPEFMEILANLALDTGAHIFSGAVRDEYATGDSFNSSVLISPEGAELGYYDKVRLALFGEYIPFEDYLPFIGKIAFGGVSAGNEQKLFPVNNRTLGPLICFEVLFAPMAEKLRAMGADMLVVVTNLAWFGGSNAIPQELEIARMRAIETRLPLIHSANTGISGVFDPFGRFKVVRHTVAARGNLVDWGEDFQPHHAIMRRFVGAFPVSAPGTRYIPFGPVLLPWIIAGLGLLFLAIAAIQPMLPVSEEGGVRPKARSKAKPKTKTPDSTKQPRKKKRSQKEATGDAE